MLRRSIGTAFASLCALTLLLGWLSRPAEDPLAFLADYHPQRKMRPYGPWESAPSNTVPSSALYRFPWQTPPLSALLPKRFSAPRVLQRGDYEEWQVGDRKLSLSNWAPNELWVIRKPASPSWLQERWNDLKKRLGW